MYPIFRLAKEIVCARGPKTNAFDTHVSHHMCWPWDLDPWNELNNGRTLTLYDLGRIPMSIRIGMTRAMMKNGWGMTVAGSTVRYRRRIKMFNRFEIHSRVLGWDARFFYIEQAIWRQGEAMNHVMLRLAATDATGILPPEKLVAAMGYAGTASPDLPDWVQAWIDADAQRPWPPQVRRDG